MISYKSKRRLSRQVSTRPTSIINKAGEIKQPNKPSMLSQSRSASQLAPYFLNDIKLLDIAEHSKQRRGCELEEVTSVPGQHPVTDMALIVVNYGYDIARYRAGQKALTRIDRMDPVVGKKIFLEVADSQHYQYLQDSGWDYHFWNFTEDMVGLFQKEALWNIGTKLAFNDAKINKVVLIDADCAFHDNSWAYLIYRSLCEYEFVQPFAAILYSDQHDCNMDTGTIPSIAYCMRTNQQHSLAVPGGAYACTRNFFFNVLGGTWPINPVGSGDIGFWHYLYGHSPIARHDSTRILYPYGKFNTFRVGYTALLLNHYYHGPMTNRMYRTRDYIAERCITGVETVLNEDGLLVWSNSKIGQIMKKSMAKLKANTNAYLQVGRSFTLLDTKEMFKRICREELGCISPEQPLKIVTVYRKDGVHTVQQINTLRDAVKRTFKCPYKFHVVTDAKYIFSPDETIYCDIPSYLLPPGYEWVMLTKLDFQDNSSILYLDPTVRLTGSCDITPCDKDKVYLARQGRNWSTKIMYFRYLNDLKLWYNSFTPYDIGKYYPDPVNYLISQLIESRSAFNIHDVLFYLDYESGKANEKTTNVII